MFGAGPPPVPAELAPLLPLLQSISKHSLLVGPALSSANAEYEKLMDPASPSPAPPVYAARLNGLIKTLVNAEGTTAELLKARRGLEKKLEELLASTRRSLEVEEKELNSLVSRKTLIGNKKQEVELAIMGGLPLNVKEQSPGDRPSGSPGSEPDPPQVEALTPPPNQDHDDMYDDAPTLQTQGDPASVSVTPTVAQQPAFPSAPGIEMLSQLASQYQSVPVNGGGSSKKRKIEVSDEFPDLGGDDGIDADVAEMLKNDSHAA